ncbi:MAG: tetratricopeptide repeat protein [Planctomycetota bacterium]
MKYLFIPVFVLGLVLNAAAKDRINFRQIDKSKPEQKPVEGTIEKEDWQGVTIKLEGSATSTYAWEKIQEGGVEYGDEPAGIREAKGEREKGNMEGAAAGFTKAAEGLKDKPIFLVHALFNAGLCYQSLKKHDDAIKSYDDLAKAVPGNRFFKETHYNKIHCYLEKGDLAGAKTAIEAAEKAAKDLSVDQPFQILMSLKKAEVIEKEGNDAEATGKFQAVAAQAGSKYPAIAGKAKLGVARVQMKSNPTSAQGTYESITREFKGQRGVMGEAFTGLGDCLMSQGEAKGDMDMIKRAALQYEQTVVLYFPAEGQPTAAYEKALAVGGGAYVLLAQKATSDRAREMYATQARSMALTLLDQYPASSYKQQATDVRTKADDELAKVPKNK